MDAEASDAGGSGDLAGVDAAAGTVEDTANAASGADAGAARAGDGRTPSSEVDTALMMRGPAVALRPVSRLSVLSRASGSVGGTIGDAVDDALSGSRRMPSPTIWSLAVPRRARRLDAP
jgi:hypothetical protein